MRIILVISVVLFSCSSFLQKEDSVKVSFIVKNKEKNIDEASFYIVKENISTTLFDEAIEKAINDFSKTKAYKKNRVFGISYKEICESILVISILEREENKFLYSITKTIEENTLPSSYFEKDNKLFIWWDDNKKVNQEMFDILKKYNMLKEDEGGWITFLDYAMDDKKKATTYYFCKNDLKEFKRIITNISDTNLPKLKCKCDDYKIYTHQK